MPGWLQEVWADSGCGHLLYLRALFSLAGHCSGMDLGGDRVDILPPPHAFSDIARQLQCPLFDHRAHCCGGCLGVSAFAEAKKLTEGYFLELDLFFGKRDFCQPFPPVSPVDSAGNNAETDDSHRHKGDGSPKPK